MTCLADQLLRDLAATQERHTSAIERLAEAVVRLEQGLAAIDHTAPPPGALAEPGGGGIEANGHEASGSWAAQFLPPARAIAQRRSARARRGGRPT